MLYHLLKGCFAMEWNLMLALLGLVFVVHSRSDQCSVLPFLE
jgi:hypothetical protein